MNEKPLDRISECANVWRRLTGWVV